ncbi:MAG: hypothetical protein KA149_00145 [Chitinophagales bacterium]|nr:hypothetical protein [Chitinophagales bacterium]
MSKRKINYPGTRKPSDKKVCSICNEEFAARGLKAHIRLAHELKVTEVTQELTQVSGDVTQVTQSVIKVTGERTNLSYKAVINKGNGIRLPFDGQLVEISTSVKEHLEWMAQRERNRQLYEDAQFRKSYERGY